MFVCFAALVDWSVSIVVVCFGITCTHMHAHCAYTSQTHRSLCGGFLFIERMLEMFSFVVSFKMTHCRAFQFWMKTKICNEKNGKKGEVLFIERLYLCVQIHSSEARNDAGADGFLRVPFIPFSFVCVSGLIHCAAIIQYIVSSICSKGKYLSGNRANGAHTDTERHRETLTTSMVKWNSVLEGTHSARLCTDSDSMYTHMSQHVYGWTKM